MSTLIRMHVKFHMELDFSRAYMKLTVEEVMTTTAYLDLFLRSIHEPALLQTFLSFILMHTHDHVHILDTLVSRVNTPFQVTGTRSVVGWD